MVRYDVILGGVLVICLAIVFVQVQTHEHVVDIHKETRSLLEYQDAFSRFRLLSFLSYKQALIELEQDYVGNQLHYTGCLTYNGVALAEYVEGNFDILLL